MVDVAALFVSRNGPYWGRPDVDAWDEKRDARLYDGNLPVVAHPPCGRWCRMAGLIEAKYGYKQGEDDGCFEAALRSLRRCGGVLEHPAFSKAWARYGIITPVGHAWSRTLWGDWVCQVSQCAYGHRAQKLTWLLYIGKRPPEPLLWDVPQHTGRVGGCENSSTATVAIIWKTESKRTPEPFAEALINLARRCNDD